MAVIVSAFLRQTLDIHDAISHGMQYPFFDPACRKYEAIRAVEVDQMPVDAALSRFGLTIYEWRRSRARFATHGVYGLIGLKFDSLIEVLAIDLERMVFVLRQARPTLPATKMVTVLKGFGKQIPLELMRRLYASYGWALGTRPYTAVDFLSLNLKVMRLVQHLSESVVHSSFFSPHDDLQSRLEIFRRLDERGVTRRYPGSRTAFARHKADFLSFGLLGLIDKSRVPFRNSKVGFAEEGWLVLSKIQKPERSVDWHLQRLNYKGIKVSPTCIAKIFSKWRVGDFTSAFRGELERLTNTPQPPPPIELPEAPTAVAPLAPDGAFTDFINGLSEQHESLAHPGVFLFLPYLHRLRVFEMASTLLDLQPEKAYSWFSLLLLNLGRLFRAVPSLSQLCQLSERSVPLSAALLHVPSSDSLLNGLAAISELQLLALRKQLTRAAYQESLVKGRKIAFDFKMRDFTGDDVALKTIGKGPSPKRKICFPGFRPHLAWDVATGAPITLEFRNGRARATTTIKRFIQDLLNDCLGTYPVEHVYLDSEYTAEHVWQFMVDPEEGLGAELTMCVKQNKKVKSFIDQFLATQPDWLYYDENHTYTRQTFTLPISGTDRLFQCVLKRHEPTGRLRCFGSTLATLDANGILQEYSNRWTIENGIKDLIGSYYFDTIPGIDPHRVNIHYYVVTLARLLFHMLTRDLGEDAFNADHTVRTLSTLRPEFIAGVNASITRRGRQLVITWTDPAPQAQHDILCRLFEKLNQQAGEQLPFIGGLGLKFEPPPLRPKDQRNRLRRKPVDF